MKITAQTSYAAVIGHPIAHSLSPLLHNTIYGELGLDIIYMAFDIPNTNLSKAIEGLKTLNFLGFNITIPHKIEVIDYLNEIDSVAAAIGAVNTVKIDKGRLIGYNTDGLGFLDSLKTHGIICRDREILIIGAGGAARAIGISFVGKRPKKIHILNRDADRGKNLARDINDFSGHNLSAITTGIPRKIDIIINTTPIGMWPNTLANPLEGYNLHPSTIVCDIVYNPSVTSLLKYAKAAGCRVVDGIGMLVGQGIKAAEIWTGNKVNNQLKELVSEKLLLSLEQRG